MVELFLKGGPFMYPILGLLIFGLLIVLERSYTLTKSTLITRKFLPLVRNTLKEGGVKAALEVCEKTPGPIAEIFHAGLSKSERGVAEVEKSIESAGTIELAFLERGMIWLSTVVTIAPMLGFTGTVSGMIRAFDDIAAANEISPSIVASGISEALLTTLFGLVVAMIIQFFHNLFSSRIDKLIVDMEESSVELIDTLTLMEIQKS